MRQICMLHGTPTGATQYIASLMLVGDTNVILRCLWVTSLQVAEQWPLSGYSLPQVTSTPWDCTSSFLVTVLISQHNSDWLIADVSKDHKTCPYMVKKGTCIMCGFILHCVVLGLNSGLHLAVHVQP